VGAGISPAKDGVQLVPAHFGACAWYGAPGDDVIVKTIKQAVAWSSLWRESLHWFFKVEEVLVDLHDCTPDFGLLGTSHL